MFTMKDRGVFPLWTHTCYLADWSNKRPIQIIDEVSSDKVPERLLVLLEVMYPVWASMHTVDNIVKNYTLTKQPLKLTLEGRDDEDED